MAEVARDLPLVEATLAKWVREKKRRYRTRWNENQQKEAPASPGASFWLPSGNL